MQSSYRTFLAPHLPFLLRVLGSFSGEWYLETRSRSQMSSLFLECPCSQVFLLDRAKEYMTMRVSMCTCTPPHADIDTHSHRHTHTYIYTHRYAHVHTHIWEYLRIYQTITSTTLLYLCILKQRVHTTADYVICGSQCRRKMWCPLSRKQKKSAV